MRPVVSLVPTTFQQIESCERSCRRTAHLYPAGKQEAKRAGLKVAVDKHDFSCFSAKLPEIWPPAASRVLLSWNFTSFSISCWLEYASRCFLGAYNTSIKRQNGQARKLQ